VISSVRFDKRESFSKQAASILFKQDLKAENPSTILAYGLSLSFVRKQLTGFTSTN